MVWGIIGAYRIQKVQTSYKIPRHHINHVLCFARKFSSVGAKLWP